METGCTYSLHTQVPTHALNSSTCTIKQRKKTRVLPVACFAITFRLSADMLGAVRALRVSCRISYDGGLSKAFTFTEGTYGAQGGLQLLQGCMTLVAATEAGVSQGGLCEEQTGPAAGSDQHKHCYADVEAYRNRVLLHRTPRCWHLPSSPSISWPASTPLLAVQYSYSKQLQVTASSMYSTVADAPGELNSSLKQTWGLVPDCQTLIPSQHNMC